MPTVIYKVASLGRSRADRAAANHWRVLPEGWRRGGLFQLLSFYSSDPSLMLKKRFYLNNNKHNN